MNAQQADGISCHPKEALFIVCVWLFTFRLNCIQLLNIQWLYCDGQRLLNMLRLPGKPGELSIQVSILVLMSTVNVICHCSVLFFIINDFWSIAHRSDCATKLHIQNNNVPNGKDNLTIRPYHLNGFFLQYKT